ncbi:MAG: ChaB family protein [Sphaerochaetaceae bacterium]|jgi:cation transport regulator ChaB
MSYTDNQSLPEAIKNTLPAEAQSVWRSTYNSASASGHGESSCARIAWTAVERAGWHKKDDKWVKKFTPIAKVDEDHNLVFGWAYVSVRKSGDAVIDHSQEMIDPDELEEAAYLFNLEFRKSGVMHQGGTVGRLIESFVVTPDKLEKMELPPNALPMGWWVGFYIEDDEIFNKVKSGEYEMFSIQGKAEREEVV